jgi:hypothetical protein
MSHHPNETTMTGTRLDEGFAAPTSAESRRTRRGTALVLTLLIIVVLAVLSTGAVLGSMQEYRAGRNSLVEQRAFAVAEFGLNQEISRWKRSRNLPAPAGMATGAVDSASVFVAQGDTARVKITRLNENTFWVVSVGRANIGNGQLESQRQTHMLVRIAYPSINPGGAIVTAGNIDVKGSADITGDNTDPDGWTQCPQLAGRDTFAISYAPGKTASIQKPNQVVGGWHADPAAADSNTYVRFGTESWQSLVAGADVTIPGGNYSPQPAGSATACDYSVQNNWGEPQRGAGAVLGCKDFFPIIYVSGSLHLSHGRGQGILLVNGDVRLNGNFQWYGLIIARDDIVKGNGTFDLWGSIMSRNADVNDHNSVTGNSSFKWSKCAVESALRGSAILTRTRERSWVQLY